MNEKWSLGGIGLSGFGLALFHDKPLFVWSLGYMPEFTWPSDKSFNLVLGFGILHTHNPRYKNYGPIYQVLELALDLS